MQGIQLEFAINNKSKVLERKQIKFSLGIISRLSSGHGVIVESTTRILNH
jgi:hypothetical protein